MPLVIDLLRNDQLGKYQDAYAREWAVNKRHLRAVRELLPEDVRLDCQHPLILLAAAAVALVNAAWEAGAIAGDALARAEVAMAPAERICRHCDGNGWVGRGPDQDARDCPVCQRTGLVPVGDVD